MQRQARLAQTQWEQAQLESKAWDYYLDDQLTSDTHPRFGICMRHETHHRYANPRRGKLGDGGIVI